MTSVWPPHCISHSGLFASAFYASRRVSIMCIAEYKMFVIINILPRIYIWPASVLCQA